MSDKFDLDSIKSLLDSSNSTSGDDGFSLDDIMRDFGDSTAKKEDLKVGVADVAACDISHEDDETSAPPLSIEEIIEKKSVSKPIVDEIVKPEGYSLTGAFEAIRSEKSADNVTQVALVEELPNDETTVVEDEVLDEPVSEEIVQQDLRHETGNEILAPIEHKRFFNTDMFESIKDKSNANVKESIASFANGIEEEDDGEEEFYKPKEPTEEIDDYDKTEDREDIIRELKKINSTASLRSLFTFVLAIISGLFFAVGNSWIVLPGIDAASEFKVFTTILFGISVLATVININSIISGLKSLVKFSFTTETYIVFIFIFNAVLDIVYLVRPVSDSAVVISFDFIYLLFLFFNIFSKKLTAKTVYKNFLIASSEGNKNVVNMPNNEEALNDIMLETGCCADVVYASKTEIVTDFISKSFKDFEPNNTKLNTVLALIVLGITAVNYFIKGDAVLAVIYVMSALCGTLPILFSFSFSAPLYFNSKKTRKQGGVIVGSESGAQLKDVQTLIVDDSDVFNTSLNGIRLYGDTQIDDAILYLNSLYRKVGGPLMKLFSDMLSEEITSLPRIDEIYYHDTMGYSGLIHSKVFVAGNKKLMDHFGVDVDDSEYEIIYQQKSKHVLFVAYDGKLMGVFLLSYSLAHGVSKAFEICEKNQIAVCIAERDASVNERTLFDAYKPKEKVLFNIISFRTARNCFDKFEVRHKTPSLLISHTGIKGLAASLHSCKTMQFAFKTNKIITTLASVIAIPLITFLLFFSDPSSSLAVQVLVYQALWSLPILFVSLFSK